MTSKHTLHPRAGQGLGLPQGGSQQKYPKPLSAAFLGSSQSALNRCYSCSVHNSLLSGELFRSRDQVRRKEHWM